MALVGMQSERFHDRWDRVFRRQLAMFGAEVVLEAKVENDPPVTIAGVHTPIASEEERMAGGFEDQKVGYVAVHNDDLGGTLARPGDQITIAGAVYHIIRRTEEPESAGDKEVKLWVQGEHEGG